MRIFIRAVFDHYFCKICVIYRASAPLFSAHICELQKFSSLVGGSSATQEFWEITSDPPLSASRQAPIHLKSCIARLSSVAPSQHFSSHLFPRPFAEFPRRRFRPHAFAKLSEFCTQPPSQPLPPFCSAKPRCATLQLHSIISSCFVS